MICFVCQVNHELAEPVYLESLGSKMFHDFVSQLGMRSKSVSEMRNIC